MPENGDDKDLELDFFEEEENESIGEGEKTPHRRSMLYTELPAEEQLLREARSLAGDKNARISNLAKVAYQDPVITLELLRVANATFFAGDRPAIANVQTAVVRLGSKTIIEILDSLQNRPQIGDPFVFETFENLRSLARRTSIVARIIAQMTHGDIADLAKTAGLMTYIGHMIACTSLGEAYAEEARTRKRIGLVYRILSHYQIDINTVGLDYLRNNGVPHILFFGLNRELQCRTPAQSALRFIVESSLELVDAHKDGKWDKYSPKKPLPKSSSLRLLQMNAMQYEHIFDTIETYLNKPDNALTDSEEEEEEEVPEEELEAPFDDEEDVEDFSFDELDKDSSSDTFSKKEKRTIVLKRDGFKKQEPPRKTLVLTGRGWGGYDPAAQPTTFLETDEGELEHEQQSLSEDGQKVLDLINYLCRDSETCQALLAKIMKLLISEGPFIRAALITLGDKRQSADIHTAVGEGFVKEEEIKVKDPLSPLALCLTSIKSFNSKEFEDILSPFGVSAYAVSPIKVKHKTPVVLYADCGLDQPLAMEARKVFRLVVGLLNRALPKLPGGLPSKYGETLMDF